MEQKFPLIYRFTMIFHTNFYSPVSGTRDKILSLLMRLGQKSAGKLCYLSIEEAAFTNFPEGIQLSIFFK